MAIRKRSAAKQMVVGPINQLAGRGGSESPHWSLRGPNVSISKSFYSATIFIHSIWCRGERQRAEPVARQQRPSAAGDVRHKTCGCFFFCRDRWGRWGCQQLTSKRCTVSTRAAANAVNQSTVSVCGEVQPPLVNRGQGERCTANGWEWEWGQSGRRGEV